MGQYYMRIPFYGEPGGEYHQSITIPGIFSLLQEAVNECAIPYLSFERRKRAY